MPKANIDLSTLSQGIPVFIDEMADFLRASCIICFSKQNHQSGVVMSCQLEDENKDLPVVWAGDYSDKMDRALGKDFRKVVDWAAVAISLLLVRDFTKYTAIEQSSLGTSFDYYLSEKNTDSDLIFNYSACIEITGILIANSKNSVKKRMKSKVRRFKPRPTMETLVAVVEFNKPQSVLEKI